MRSKHERSMLPQSAKAHTEGTGLRGSPASMATTTCHYRHRHRHRHRRPHITAPSLSFEVSEDWQLDASGSPLGSWSPLFLKTALGASREDSCLTNRFFATKTMLFGWGRNPLLRDGLQLGGEPLPELSHLQAMYSTCERRVPWRLVGNKGIYHV